MKRHIYILLASLLCIITFSCKEDTLYKASRVHVQTAIIGVDDDAKTITLRTVIAGDVPITDIDDIELQVSQHGFDGSEQRYQIASGITTDTILSSISATAGKKYAFRYVLRNQVSQYITEPVNIEIDANFKIYGAWQELTPVPASRRSGAIAFEMDGKGYFGLGKDSRGNALKDLWQYDPTTDSWTQVSSMPTPFGLYMASCFTIDGIAYIVGGYDGQYYQRTTLAYNPKTDEWKSCARFPSKGRTSAAAFSLLGKGYIVGGYADSLRAVKEVWCYDPAANEWSKKKDVPFGAYTGMYAFSTISRGFVGGGYDNDKTFAEGMYAYIPKEDKWVIAESECPHVAYAIGFSSDRGGYIGSGEYKDPTLKQGQFYYFDSDKGEVSDLGTIRDDEISKAAGFRIGSTCYIISGANNKNQLQNCVLSYSIK